MTQNTELTCSDGAQPTPRTLAGRVGGDNIAVICGGGSQVTDGAAAVCKGEIVAIPRY